MKELPWKEMEIVGYGGVKPRFLTTFQNNRISDKEDLNTSR